jgi:hypothetical protein
MSKAASDDDERGRGLKTTRFRGNSQEQGFSMEPLGIPEELPRRSTGGEEIESDENEEEGEEDSP